MKTMEKWIYWKPIKNVSPIYYVHSITDTLQSLKIILNDAENIKKKLKIDFIYGVNAYSRTDDNLRLKLIDELDEQYKGEFYSKWTFFKVENSRYIQWLTEQSYGVINPKTLIHYAIFEEDLILDIIATYEPTVTFIE